MALESSAVGVLTLRGNAQGVTIAANYNSAAGKLHLIGRILFHEPYTRIASDTFGFLGLLHGTAQGYINQPYGSFRDFAHYPAGSLDPAKVLVTAHNGGAITSDNTQAAGYRRYYVISTPPLDYPVSGEKDAWTRAAYVGIGLKFRGFASNGYQYVDAAQIEVSKYGATGPTPYVTARSTQSVVYPPWVNLATNPAAVTSDGVINTALLGVMPNVVDFVQGSDYDAWQSTEQAYMGVTSAAIRWRNTPYPSIVLYPSNRTYPDGVTG